MSHYLRVALVPLYLILCLLLGGASAAGHWANLVLQILGLGLIFWALVVERRTPMGTPGRQIVALLILLLVVGAIQLVPLPPSIWTKLAARDEVAAGYELIGQPLPWLPISLAPNRTLSSLLWLLPAIAALLGTLKLGAFKGSWIAWSVAAVTTLSVAIGAMQVSGGEASPLYFYDITNIGAAVGFFANANHQATLLLATIPFLAALNAASVGEGSSAQRSSALLVVLAGALMVLAIGIFISGSLAGYGLLIPVVAASVIMIASRKRRIPRWATAILGVVALAAIYIPFSAPLGNNLTAEEASTDQFSRYTSFTKSAEAAKDFFPLGSGIGSFLQIYRRYEDPTAVQPTYVNHVHSDYIEIALETGLLGLSVLLLFLLWWVSRTIRIWSAEKPDYFARAATIATAAILAHSAVDYPLRTAAISALFAVCCALMADPRSRVRRDDEAVTRNQARHLSAD